VTKNASPTQGAKLAVIMKLGKAAVIIEGSNVHSALIF
jgi:hypothetical protein